MAVTGSAPGLVVTIQVGMPAWYGEEGGEGLDKRWETGYIKTGVSGPVRLGTLGLEGDGQADRESHGGPDQAVLCYSADHYPVWRQELNMPDLPFGAFAENLTVSGQSEWDVCIGDVYQVGESVVQVSSPRGPCWKIPQRWRRPEMLEMVERTGRHGWYMRVIQEGLIEAGETLALRERPYPQWTVRAAADAYRFRGRDRETAARLLECEALSAKAQRKLRVTLEGRD